MALPTILPVIIMDPYGYGYYARPYWRHRYWARGHWGGPIGGTIDFRAVDKSRCAIIGV
jgi:hypothetical protein